MSNLSNKEIYKGIYSMHKYWGRKPFNVVSEFIKKYTLEGDIVLDSFCGSGVTIIEASKLKRKAIGIDLNPMAIKLTKASLVNVDIQKLKEEFNNIKNELQPIINSLYTMTCPICDAKAIQTHIVWKDDEPTEVWYQCDNCKKKKIIKQATDMDKEMSENPMLKPLWYPDTLMFENSRINVRADQKVSDLFTNRALVALSYIYDRVKKIEDSNIRESLELTFTGAISQASKLVFVIRSRNKKTSKNDKQVTLDLETEEDNKSEKDAEVVGRAEVGSWVIGYWVPQEHFEINAWNCFENRFKRILKGQEEINEIFKSGNKIYDNFLEFKEDKDFGVLLKNGTATKLDLPDNYINYVFIDPPHGNRILYMEQSLMWNSWLGLDNKCNWEEEIIVSEAKKRNKNVPVYTKMMDDALTEIKRVLKPNGYFSMAFNTLDDETCISMINMCLGTGFEIVDIHPLEYSAMSVVQDNRQNALKTDFVLTCKKNIDAKSKEIVYNKDDNEITKAIEEILINQELETYDIINKLLILNLNKGVIYPPTKITNILEKRFTCENSKWKIKKN